MDTISMHYIHIIQKHLTLYQTILTIACLLQVEVKNVKSFQILNSTFAHIRQLGISVATTGDLKIMDNIFLKV